MGKIRENTKHKSIKGRMGRLLTRYHSKFKFLETAHLMHKNNKADLATLIDQYRQAMEVLQAMTERDSAESKIEKMDMEITPQG